MEARQKFEALPEFREGLMHCHYNESINDYCSNVAHDTEWEWNTQFVSGGWCAFQEQQRKLDVVLNTILWHIEDCDLVEDSEYNSAWRDAMVFMQQELMK